MLVKRVRYQVQFWWWGRLPCLTANALLQVLKVEDGVCTVSYQGPAPIGMGIQAAIKDKFPDIRTVLGC